EGRGIFGLLSTIPELIVGVGNVGMGPALFYYVAKEKYDLRRVMGALMVFILSVCALLAGLGYLAFEVPQLFRGETSLALNYKGIVIMAIPLLLIEHLGFQILVAKAHVMGRMVSGILASLLPLLLFLVMWKLFDEALD